MRVVTIIGEFRGLYALRDYFIDRKWAFAFAFSTTATACIDGTRGGSDRGLARPAEVFKAVRSSARWSFSKHETLFPESAGIGFTASTEEKPAYDSR